MKVRDTTDWDDINNINDCVDSISFGDGVYIQVTTDIDNPYKGKENGFIWLKIVNESLVDDERFIDEQDSKDNTDREIRIAAISIIAANQVYLGLDD